MIIDEEWEELRDKKFLQLYGVLERCLEWLENAPFDYSNGNEYCGIDEGNVRGWEGHKELIDAIRTVLPSCELEENK